jgi:hypothetical protein
MYLCAHSTSLILINLSFLNLNIITTTIQTTKNRNHEGVRHLSNPPQSKIRTILTISPISSSLILTTFLLALAPTSVFSSAIPIASPVTIETRSAEGEAIPMAPPGSSVNEFNPKKLYRRGDIMKINYVRMVLSLTP